MQEAAAWNRHLADARASAPGAATGVAPAPPLVALPPPPLSAPFMLRELHARLAQQQSAAQKTAPPPAAAATAAATQQADPVGDH